MPYDLEFYVCRSVYGYGWTISFKVVCMMTPSFELRYSAMSSALDADEITFRMMVDTKCTAPFFITGCPCFGLFVKKKRPTSLLRDFGLDRYEASLWISIIV